jgi:transcription initiation factor TFIID subunit 6
MSICVPSSIIPLEVFGGMRPAADLKADPSTTRQPWRCTSEIYLSEWVPIICQFTTFTMSSPAVQPAVRSTLVTLAEEHLTQLVREAVCVQKHCKRARIHLHGDGDQPGVVKRRLHAEDINMALQWRSSEKIYATGTIGSSSSDDKKVNLQDYLKSEMDLRPPHEVGLTMHWLAVDGIQPDIPQNPDQETSASTANRVEQDEDPNGAGSGSSGVHVTQLLPRLLSEELQLYFTRITTAVERGGTNPTTRQQQDASLAGVSRDSGLQELVPFLVRYVAESLNKNLGNPEHCRTLVRMARSLLVNPHLHLELHVRTLLGCMWSWLDWIVLFLTSFVSS